MSSNWKYPQKTPNCMSYPITISIPREAWREFWLVIVIINFIASTFNSSTSVLLLSTLQNVEWTANHADIYQKLSKPTGFSEILQTFNSRFVLKTRFLFFKFACHDLLFLKFTSMETGIQSAYTVAITFSPSRPGEVIFRSADLLTPEKCLALSSTFWTMV